MQHGQALRNKVSPGTTKPTQVERNHHHPQDLNGVCGGQGRGKQQRWQTQVLEKPKVTTTYTQEGEEGQLENSG